MNSGISIQTWTESGDFFQYEEGRYFYHVAGDGPPLLLLHGFPTCSWDWVPIWQELIQHFQVIAFDFKGFGLSDKPFKGTYTIVEQADIAEALLAFLDIERVHVLAHDYGVTVAQELLARHEGRVKGVMDHGPIYESVVFLNGGLFPETHRPRPIQKLLSSPFGVVLSRLLSFRSFAKSFSKVFGPQTQPSLEELKVHWHFIRMGKGHRITHKLLNYIQERYKNRERWVGALCQTQVPLRLINGPEDPVSGAHMAARYQELLPDGDIIILEGVGHYPQIEAPAGVLRAFFAFHKRLRTIAIQGNDTLPGIKL